MKNKSGQRTLWILLAVLAVLLIAFFILRSSNEKKAEKEEKSKEAAVVHIYKTDSLEKFSYEDSEGKEMSFSKQDGEWKYSKDTTIPLSADTVSGMADAFSDIVAVKEIEKPDELKDYGLAEPSYKLLLTDKEGKDDLLLIGGQTGENYYIMREDDEKVYTVSADIVSQMVWDVKDLVQKENFVSVTEDNFVKEVITRADGTETVYDSEDTQQEDKVSEVAKAFAGFYFTDCADYHVTDETLDKYGLDEKNRTKVVLTYKETNSDGDEEQKEVTFYVGGKDSTDTYYYVQLDGSQMVNTVTIANVDAVM